MKHGLHFIGAVKTAHRKFPMKAIQEQCPEPRCSHVVASATSEGKQILAIGCRDKKVLTLVGTCRTTVNGAPAKKDRYSSETGNVVIKTVPTVVQQYHDGAPAIDIHNHIQQVGLALEKSWGTHKWQHRISASLFGIIEMNALLAYNYFTAV